MLVHVYYNRTKRVWSIRHKGRVIRHADSVALSDCTWVVQPKGNERCRKTGNRDVHAYAKGTLIENPNWNYYEIAPSREVTYHPMRNTTFIFKDSNTPVSFSAVALFLKGGRALALNRYV